MTLCMGQNSMQIRGASGSILSAIQQRGASGSILHAH